MIDDKFNLSSDESSITAEGQDTIEAIKSMFGNITLQRSQKTLTDTTTTNNSPSPNSAQSSDANNQTALGSSQSGAGTSSNQSAGPTLIATQSPPQTQLGLTVQISQITTDSMDTYVSLTVTNQTDSNITFSNPLLVNGSTQMASDGRSTFLPIPIAPGASANGIYAFRGIVDKSQTITVRINQPNATGGRLDYSQFSPIVFVLNPPK